MAEAQRRAPPVTDTWIMARRQTAGRGRQGRAWTMPEGNFAATLLCPSARPASDVALTSFQAALAVYDTLAHFIDSARLTIKWPNDVLLDGCKVAGILLETSGTGAGTDWVAIGIGINVVAAPPPEALEPGALPAISLSAAGALDVTLAEVLQVLAFHMDHHATIWRQRGFEPLRRLWLERAANLGTPIRARTAHATLHGRFAGIDEHGRLLLETADGTQKLSAGDVFFG